MRIKVTRDSVIDKLNPLEKSPKHKKLPQVLRSKTPDKARRADVISPKDKKGNFISPKRTRSKVQTIPKRSKAKATNLINAFNKAKSSKEEETGLEILQPAPSVTPLISLDLPLEDEPIPVGESEHVSLVSMKTGPEPNETNTPPPLKIKRSWKRHLPSFASGYKLFTPESPAKAAASPHNLAIKLCFLGRLTDNSPSTRSVHNRKQILISSLQRCLLKKELLQNSYLFVYLGRTWPAGEFFPDVNVSV